MSDEKLPVAVKILDKEFRVSCPANERDALFASAELLNQRMREVRDSGKVFGTDRVAIMAALNLTHELLQQRHVQQAEEEALSRRIEAMQARIERALAEAGQKEL